MREAFNRSLSPRFSSSPTLPQGSTSVTHLSSQAGELKTLPPVCKSGCLVSYLIPLLEEIYEVIIRVMGAVLPQEHIKNPLFFGLAGVVPHVSIVTRFFHTN